MEDRKRKGFGTRPEKNESTEHRMSKRAKKHMPSNPRTNELHMSSGGGLKRAGRGRQSDGVKSIKDQPERSGKTNKENYNKGPKSGRKRKIDETNMSKGAAGRQRPGTNSNKSTKLFKHKKVGRKQ